MAVPFSISALHTELFTDPASLGYGPSIPGDENTLADLLNVVRAGGAYQVDRDPVQVADVFAVVAPEDFARLTTTNLAQLQAIFTLPTIALALSNVRENLAGIFGSNSPTQQALVVLQKRQGSRAEALWGKGMIISTNQVDQAIYQGG